ncbi:MAG TPA: hypothetical protein PK544_05390 [Spirochaetota bacterium]|nr:hypothetical protein [Spirochaetota bacterium]HPJ37592.1 hypothetical protein [Spirochaetota bacterium]HPQ51986.1 hypothetical protein [Spirochaetota bacterium]
MRTPIKLNNLYKMLICAAVAASCFYSSDICAQQPKQEQQQAAGEDNGNGITGWRIKDFQPYIKAMKDLERFNIKYADDRLKLARDEYSKALDILEDMEQDIRRMVEKNKQGKHLNERWHWQEVDRLNQLNRRVIMKKQEAKTKAVTYLTRSINYLDGIEEVNKEYVTKNKTYKNFKIKLFQVYVSTQHDLHNYRPCIPVLERYITINSQTKEDVWAYKYLASSYAYVEGVLAKSRGVTEDQIIHYKQKKNEYLLTAVKIEYGVQSPEYKHMKEVVERDEMRTQRLNDYQ